MKSKYRLAWEKGWKGKHHNGVYVRVLEFLFLCASPHSLSFRRGTCGSPFPCLAAGPPPAPAFPALPCPQGSCGLVGEEGAPPPPRVLGTQEGHTGPGLTDQGCGKSAFPSGASFHSCHLEPRRRVTAWRQPRPVRLWPETPGGPLKSLDLRRSNSPTLMVFPLSPRWKCHLLLWCV